MSHGDAESSVMLQVPTVGPFVRALLPVHLSGGFTLTFGVWIGVHPDDLQRAVRVWWLPEYTELVLEGRLANALPRWGQLGAPVVARVQNIEHTPYIVDTSSQELAAVLHEEWPHDVLDGLP